MFHVPVGHENSSTSQAEEAVADLEAALGAGVVAVGDVLMVHHQRQLVGVGLHATMQALERTKDMLLPFKALAGMKPMLMPFMDGICRSNTMMGSASAAT